MSRKTHRNRFKSIFRLLNRFKVFKKIDLNRFKINLNRPETIFVSAGIGSVGALRTVLDCQSKMDIVKYNYRGRNTENASVSFHF